MSSTPPPSTTYYKSTGGHVRIIKVVHYGTWPMPLSNSRIKLIDAVNRKNK